MAETQEERLQERLAAALCRYGRDPAEFEVEGRRCACGCRDSAARLFPVLWDIAQVAQPAG